MFFKSFEKTEENQNLNSFTEAAYGGGERGDVPRWKIWGMSLSLENWENAPPPGKNRSARRESRNLPLRKFRLLRIDAKKVFLSK